MSDTVSGMSLPEILDDAIERAGGQTATGAHVLSARRSMRILLEAWNAKGFRTWKISEVVISGVGPTILVPRHVDDIFQANVESLGQTCGRSSETSMRRLSASEYARIPTKHSPGQPAQFYLERTDPPKIHVFPAGRNGVTEKFHLWCVERPAEWDRESNDFDAPGRWLVAVITGIALDLAKKLPNPKGLIDMERVNLLKDDYREALSDATRADRERVNVRIKIA